MIPNVKLIAAGAVLVVLFAAMMQYGAARYAAGVRDTAAKYLKADMAGVETVNATTRKVLGDIGDDADPDSLLGRTGGLRDE